MPSSFRPDIQALRGIAVLMVVLYHAQTPGFSGGYLGVDVFFVLSGYLITRMLVEEWTTAGKVDALAFYARRARRLFPALVAATIAALGGAFLLSSPVDFTRTARAGAASSVYLANIHFARTHADYFSADAAPNPFLHTWSLAVEEQFYILWPALLGLTLFLCCRHVGRPRVHLRLALAILSIGVASFALAIGLRDRHSGWMFYSSPTRAWEFALGGLASLAPSLPRGRGTHWLAWGSLLSIVAACATVPNEAACSPTTLLIPTLAATVLLCAGARSPGIAPLQSRPLQWLGDISYSLYLWHWPILALGAPALGTPSPVERAALLVLSLVCALGSYHLVERPIRQNRALAVRPGKSLALAFSAATLSALLSLGSERLVSRTLKSPEYAQIVEARADGPSESQACNAGFPDRKPRLCPTGPSPAAGTLVLFGDSHALSWFDAIRAIAEQRHWRLISLTKSACSPASVDYTYPDIGRVYDECTEWRREALTAIQALRPDLVIVTGSQWYARSSSTAPPAVPSADWASGLDSTLSSLSRSATQVVLIRDNPRPGFDVVACLASRRWRHAWWPGPECTFARSDGLDSQVFAAEKLAAAHYANVRTIDLSDLACPADTCPVQQGAIVIYRDSSHLTRTFTLTVASSLRDALFGPTPGGRSK